MYICKYKQYVIKSKLSNKLCYAGVTKAAEQIATAASEIGGAATETATKASELAAQTAQQLNETYDIAAKTEAAVGAAVSTAVGYAHELDER